MNIEEIKDWPELEFVEPELGGVGEECFFVNVVYDVPPEEQRPIIQPREIASLVWLAKEIKVDSGDLVNVIERIRTKRPVYRVRYIPKSDGSKRQICMPCISLKTIQARINKHILSSLFRPSPNIFGFSGGDIVGAISPHLKSKTILCVDFKDAFPTVSSEKIFEYLTAGRSLYWRVGREPTRMASHGLFSWYVARMLVELTTYIGSLPQGAPTSPRIFDLMCSQIDRKLSKLAKKVGGAYTRYADNIFFSINQDEFPGPLRQAILKLIDGRKRSAYGKNKHNRFGPQFKWHKLRIKKMGRSPQRMLGLNVIEGKIHNTRAFKRRLRLSLHHIKWLLDNGMKDTIEFETALEKIHGQMSFTIIETVSKKLLDGYSGLINRLN